MKKLSTIEISGGLGNQLFQYWLGQRIHLDADCEIKYQTTSLAHHRTPRELELLHFKLENMANLETRDASRFGWIVSRITNALLLRSDSMRTILSRLTNRYFATEIGYGESPEQLTRYKRITGLFQSHLYLEPIRGKILREMNLKTPSKKYEDFALIMENLEPVVVHVRGGDYSALKESFGLLDFNYFLNAINMAQKLVGNRQIWLFSDDPSRVDYITESLGLKFDCVICEEEGLSSAETLKLMSKGVAIVISNSTFSWWGAWLSSAQLVIAPSKWFKGMEDPKFLYPDNWKKVTSSWM